MMVMQRHERLILAVNSGADPTIEEWHRWIELGRERWGADARCVIEVHGNIGPNARQRQALAPNVGKVDMRSAILSDSLIVRGLVTAVGWLGVPNRAFATGDLDGAARYLELTSEEHQLALAQLPALRRVAGVLPKPRHASQAARE